MYNFDFYKSKPQAEFTLYLYAASQRIIEEIFQEEAEEAYLLLMFLD